MIPGHRHDDGRQRDAQEHPARGAGQRDQQPLREVLRGELRTPGPEGDADGGLARARHGARQEQSCGVRAGDEKQQRGGPEQQQQRGTDVLDHRFAKIEQAGGVGGMIDRIFGGDFRRHAFHVRLGGGKRDPGFRRAVGDVAASGLSRGSSAIQRSVRSPAMVTPATGSWNDGGMTPVTV